MANIELLAPIILKWEGGFVNDPADAGGATNMGVTLQTWRQVGYDKDNDGDIDVADLKKLTKDEVIYKVLKHQYWNRWRADEIRNQSIANLLVDWVWASGKWGILLPQQVLGVTMDGVVGLKTLNAVNIKDQAKLFHDLVAARHDYLHRICLSRPANNKFLLGWINRLHDFKFTS